MEENLRVLCVVRPAVGGIKAHVVTLAQGLRDAGCEVVFACPADSEVANAVRDSHFPVCPVHITDAVRPITDLVCIAQIARLVRRGHFDVVHAHGFKAGIVGRLGAMLGGCPVRVLTVHNHVLYREETSAGAKMLHRSVERMLAPFTSRVITVSNSLRAELVDAYHLPSHKVVTIHNGVPSERFLKPQNPGIARALLGLPSTVPIIGSMCRFTPQKGLTYLVAALPSIRESFPDLHVVLGGDGPLRATLQEQVRAVGADDIVTFPGMVADVAAVFPALDLYVAPSLSEGLPLTLVEAAYAGLAAVSTTGGGTSEVITDGKTGVLVPPADSHALATAIIGLLADPTRLERMKRSARKDALARFAPQKMVNATLDVYRMARCRAH